LYSLRTGEENMKTYIRHIIIIIVLISFAETVMASVQQENNQMSRKEKRVAKNEQFYMENKQMIEERSFVLESDFLQDRYGHTLPVSRNINFVMVDGDQAVIQIGSNSGLGANGVGGVTAKGKITKWELHENTRKKTFNLRMNVLTSIGVYNVSISIGNHNATARLTGLRPGNLTFNGDLVALEESRVFEGRSL
jgi:hypothetical protein